MIPSKNITIGIYYPPFSNIRDVLKTLDSIILSVGHLYIKVVVIADGNNTEIDLKVTVKCSIIRNPICRGKAYCFNRLIACKYTDFFVFLEAGVLLGPHCLFLLIDALMQDSKNGLAGPSTNLSWNEQNKFPSVFLKGNYRSVSEQIKKNYEKEIIELLPLHSLSDFCYVIKREVIEKIGAADEVYGTGSCWEMDYNIRAARAGFKGIWVKGAFAERTLKWPQEDLRKSKQLYQNRFCALRKDGLNTKYKLHCLGDQCSNFAQPSLIKLKLDLPFDKPLGEENNFMSFVPLVSCIMPTSQRPHFIARAIKFFIQQDYPNKELIIVYNENTDIPHDLDLPPGVRLIRIESKSIGAKRNEACKYAKGCILAQWDDDDIYMSNRLTVQIEPLLKGEFEITGLYNFTFYETVTNSYWACTSDLYKKLFVEGIAGGTLVFLKMLWENYAVYPHISIREDAEFLKSAMFKGARLGKIDGRDVFIYIRHSLNTWRFNVGTYLKTDEWQLCEAPYALQKCVL